MQPGAGPLWMCAAVRLLDGTETPVLPATGDSMDIGKPKGSGFNDSLEPNLPTGGRSPSGRELSPMGSNSNSEPLFEKDYQRIQTLMKNPAKVMKRLGGLETSLQSGARLKDALYQTERAHGFAPTIHRTGSLENQDQFMGMVKEGMMFKDRGASHDHGENTHRLQWHAVAKDIEKHPEHYSTKLAGELYRGLAERYERGQTQKYNWKTLFDENKSTGDFRQPETFTTYLRTQTTLPALQAVTQAEATKRQKTGVRDMEGFKKGPDRNQYIQAMRSIGSDKPIYAEKLTPDTYTPRVRKPGEQPPTGVGYAPIKPITKGSK